MSSKILVKVPYFDITCKYCGGRNIIKYGHFKGTQRFWCKDCKRKFADNNALPNMQTPLTQIGSAIGMFYEGQSLNSVRRLLTQIYGNYPSDSTVYRWITRFTRQALQETKELKPNVGDEWVADETVLDIGGKKLWFWDILDSETRFLLASHISHTRTTKDAQRLMELAAEKAGKNPKVVLTDKLAVYLDGVELAYGSDTKHIATKPFTVEQNTNLIERFHGSLKDRTKVMRGLKDLTTARLIMSGWLLHYNYLRPHETLGKTPAEAAGIKFPYSNWQQIVAGNNHVSPKIGEQIVSSASFIQAPVYTEKGFKMTYPRVRKPIHRIKHNQMQTVSITRSRD